MKRLLSILLLLATTALAGTNDVLVYEYPAPSVDVAAASLVVTNVAQGDVNKTKNAIATLFDGCSIKADRNGVNLLTLTGSAGWGMNMKNYWLEVQQTSNSMLRSRCFTNELDYIGWTNRILKFTAYLPPDFVIMLHKHDHLMSDGRMGCVLEQVYP